MRKKRNINKGIKPPSVSPQKRKEWEKELELELKDFLSGRRKISASRGSPILAKKPNNPLELEEVLQDQILPENVRFFETKLNGKMIECACCGYINKTEEFEPELIDYVTVATCPDCECMGYVLLYPKTVPRTRRKKK